MLFLAYGCVLVAQQGEKNNPPLVSAPIGITKEVLEKRIEELEKQKMQLLADINAVNGALQEDKAWVNNLNLGITNQKEEKK